MQKIIYEGNRIEDLVDKLVFKDTFLIMDFKSKEPFDEDFLFYIDHVDQINSLRRLQRGARVYLERRIRKFIEVTDYPSLVFQKSLFDIDICRKEICMDGDIKRAMQFLAYLEHRYAHCIGIHFPRWMESMAVELMNHHPKVIESKETPLTFYFEVNQRGCWQLLFWDGSQKDMAKWKEIYGTRFPDKVILIPTKPFIKIGGDILLSQAGKYYGLRLQAKRLWEKLLSVMEESG